MRTFKEFLKRSNNVTSLNRVGVMSFGKGITEKNIVKTPHYEMAKSYDLIYNLGFVMDSLDKMVLFIKPSIAKFESKDKKTEEFLNEWLSKRDIDHEIEKSIFHSIATGNLYLEPVNSNTKNGEKVLDMIYTFNDSSRVYQAADLKSWVLTLSPASTSNLLYRNKVYKPAYQDIYYQIGVPYPYKRQWGILLSKNVFKHYKFGFSYDGKYGRGFIASTIDSGNVLRTIISNWDTISRTRALNQKIVQFGDSNSTIDLDDDQLDMMERKLENAEKSYLAFNVPVEVKSTDISNVGKSDKMDQEINFLRRDMNSLPSHLGQWSDTATTMGAKEGREGIRLKIENVRNKLEKIWSKEIIEGLRKTYTWLDEKAEITFGSANLAPDNEILENILGMFNTGLINEEIAVNKLKEADLLNDNDAEIMLKEIKKKKRELKRLQDAGLVDINGNPLPQPIETNPIQDDEDVEYDPKDFGEKKKKFNGFEKFKEGVEKGKKGIDLFYKRIKKKGFSPDEMTLISSNEVRGVKLRLFKTKDSWILFKGSNEIKRLPLTSFRKDAIDMLNAEVNLLKQLIKKTLKGSSSISPVIKSASKEIKKVLVEQIKNVDETLKSNLNKDETINRKTISKMNKINTGVRKKIESVINKSIKEFDLVIKKDDSENNISSVSDKVKRIKESKIDIIKRSLVEQIESNFSNTTNDIKRLIIENITSGSNYKTLKREISKKYDYSEGSRNPQDYKIERLLHTEFVKANSIIKLSRWVEIFGKDVEVQWIVYGDNKVREAHMSRNQKVFKATELLEHLTYPGGQSLEGTGINCRCDVKLFDY